MDDGTFTFEGEGEREDGEGGVDMMDSGWISAWISRASEFAKEEKKQ